MMKIERPTVLCVLCKEPTPFLATKRCDRCWELEGRIKGDPELAVKVLLTLPIPFVALVKEMAEHLDYTGYGDSWEREAAKEDGLMERVRELMEQLEGE